MRILAAADLHGARPVYEWLARTASDAQVDAVVLGGDLLGCPDGFDTPEAAQEHEAKVLAEFLSTLGLPVLYIMGNDDLVELPATCDRVRSIHGRQARLEAYTLVGYQYSLPFMGGMFEKSDAGIEADLAVLEHCMSVDTVFVSHSPMFGVLDPGIGETQIGSISLQKFLGMHPYRVHIHGHSHAGFGRQGRHFNVASAGHKRAMLLNLDTLAHEVVHER